MTKPDNTRNALRTAQLAVTAAESELASARAATTKGRNLLEETTRDLERTEATDKRDAAARTEQMKEALKSGASPSFANDRELSKSAAARVALEARRLAATDVVAELADEERKAERAVEVARAAISSEVKNILRAEAAAIASEWSDAEAKARALRIRLGRHHGFISRLTGMGAIVDRAISANHDDQLNFEEARAFGDAWETFAASLLVDPNAELSFAVHMQERAA